MRNSLGDRGGGAPWPAVWVSWAMAKDLNDLNGRVLAGNRETRKEEKMEICMVDIVDCACVYLYRMITKVVS